MNLDLFSITKWNRNGIVAIRWNFEGLMLKSLRSKCHPLVLLLSSWNNPHPLSQVRKQQAKYAHTLCAPTFPPPPSSTPTLPTLAAADKTNGETSANEVHLHTPWPTPSGDPAPKDEECQTRCPSAVWATDPRGDLVSDTHLLREVYRTEVMEAIESYPRGDSQREVAGGLRRSWMQEDPSSRRQAASVSHFPGLSLHLREARWHFTPKLR